MRVGVVGVDDEKIRMSSIKYFIEQSGVRSCLQTNKKLYFYSSIPMKNEEREYKNIFLVHDCS